MPSPNGRRTGSPSRTWTWPSTTRLSTRSRSKANCGARRRWAARTDSTEYRVWPCRAATSSSRTRLERRCSPLPTFSLEKPAGNSQKQSPSVAGPTPGRMELRGRLKEWLLASALTLLAGAASAQIQPGREFQRIEPQRPVAADGRIEVIEFFYYGCPVCYETQPFLSRWLGRVSEYVALRRVPALSAEAWEPFAKLFYALETLGQADRLHWQVYDHFHFENVKLNDEKIMADWVARNDIERQRFVEVYGSSGVAARVAQARELLQAYDVCAVPTFIVDGKFLTSARLAGGTEQVIQG